MGFPRQEYWSGFPCPSPGDLPDPGIKPVSLGIKPTSLTSLTLAGGFFTPSATWEDQLKTRLKHQNHKVMSPTRSSWPLCNEDHLEASPKPCPHCLPTSLWSVCSLGRVSSSMPGLSRVLPAIKSLLYFTLLSHPYWILLFTPWEIRKCKRPWKN